MQDLIVIGLGPAGIAAALYAARQNLDCLAISKDIGGMANLIPDIENYLGYHYMSGYDLVSKFKQHLKDYKVKMKLEEEVLKIEKSKGGFVVVTNKGKYETRTIIVTSGRKFKHLKVPGEAEFINKGVSHCAVCDGPLFKGKTVAVIGGGRAGLLSTLYIMKMMKKIYVIEVGPELGKFHVWRDAVKKAKNVEIMTNTKTLEIVGDQVVTAVKVETNGKQKTIPVEAVFIEIGYDNNIEFLRHAEVRLTDRGEIIIDKLNRTNVPGIFAAGDCTDILMKQVVVAVGEGAKAALSALEYLEEHYR
ncbi:MAG TPA: FAD-dependent oxidoreductase [archaeon]|nr:FAD-dependent oxidoreductase [archaeon]